MRKMKNSGIEWIGEIPEDWEIRSFKIHFQLEKGLSITKENLIETGYPVISYGQIHSKKNFGTKVNDSLIKFVNNEYLKTSQHCLANKNDFIFADTSEDTDGIGNFIFIDRARPIFAGYHTIIARPTNIYFPKYYAYLFYADCWRNQLRSYAAGIKVFSITKKLLSHTNIINPPKTQQVAIANFLDEKCALIDRLVERHQKVIEKLKAYRQSVISEAVTRGLDPDAPMKDSGIPWIGKIPEGWKIDKIKYISKFNPGCSRHFERHESVGYLPMECLKHGYMTPLKTEYEKITSALTCFEDGDIVLAKVTPCFENGNISIAQNLENHTGFGSSELFVFRCSGYETRFLFYIFQNSNFMNECISTMTGTGGLKRVSSDFIRNCRIPVPDLQLQQQIADYLDEKCAKIDRIIHDKEQIIAKLAEYKKSIIYEYVTGKKEVPAS